jgi:hypothetical protein
VCAGSMGAAGGAYGWWTGSMREPA